MTPITDRICSHPQIHDANAIYLGRDERRQFRKETEPMLVKDVAHLGLKHPDGPFAQYQGMAVYEVDAQSHFGLGFWP